MFGRGGATIRMLLESGADFEWKDDYPSISSVWYGHLTSLFLSAHTACVFLVPKSGIEQAHTQPPIPVHTHLTPHAFDQLRS